MAARQNNSLIHLRLPTQKEGTSKILELTEEIAALWHELALYIALKLCCGKNQAKEMEDQHIFELLGGVNPEYETECTQVTSKILTPIETVCVLFKARKVEGE